MPGFAHARGPLFCAGGYRQDGAIHKLGFVVAAPCKRMFDAPIH
jgi:hypothetical protein